ncbi:MAG: SPOR domain-containing protein [Chlorobiaceae bacterium]|nr:SPOR domain-containing protein [Chlorobiaceae bacterium]
MLETLRQKATRPSEQTVIDALLLEDGPQAIALYRKQLREYPDPAIDPISSSRVASYNVVIPDSDTTAKSALPPVLAEQLPAEVQDTTKHSVTPLARAVSSSKQQPPAVKDTTKLTAALQAKAIGAALRAPEKVKPLTTAGTCTLQFGSFSNRRNAEILAEKISGNIPVEVILHKGVHKVQLKTIYASHDEAVTAAKKLPFDSIVVPVR